jgi:hypothetical protein
MKSGPVAMGVDQQQASATTVVDPHRHSGQVHLSLKVGFRFHLMLPVIEGEWVGQVWRSEATNASWWNIGSVRFAHCSF